MLSVRRCLWTLSLVALVVTCGARPAGAQETFDQAIEQWRQVLKDLRELKVRFQAADEVESAEITTQWAETVAEGERLIPLLRTLGLKAFESDPNGDRELTKFLVRILADDIAADRYDEAFAMAKRLIELGCDAPKCPTWVVERRPRPWNSNSLGNGLAWRPTSVLSGRILQEHHPHSARVWRIWAEELEIRKREESLNLPRVLLTTTDGEIELELFENEAPGAVGDFISLEAGFYDGLSFHRVLGNFMAQGGCPKGDGTGDPGYSILCECYQENARRHFRGSLSMANAGRDTGGSQFFLTFMPTPDLNGKHTVFGRIVRGFDVLPKIKRRDPESEAQLVPDKIISAKVLRKVPNKVYLPNKVQ